ncbi:hypothetical protein ACU4GD_24235 [Cupriavidus basilensis]
MSPATSNNRELLALFHAHAGLHAVAVVSEDDTPLAIVNRHYLIDRFAVPFPSELYGRESLHLAWPIARRSVSALSASIEEMAQALAGRGPASAGRRLHHHRAGALPPAALAPAPTPIRAVTEIPHGGGALRQPADASLPGNMPLNRHIDRY